MLVEHAANSTDINFIQSCFLYGARKGHYAFVADNSGMVNAMKNEVRSIVEHHLLQDGRHAVASVYYMNNRRVGSSVLCEALQGMSCYEIYALSVAQSFQRKGLGSSILDMMLERLVYVDVYARCSAESSVMLSLLQKRGFRIDHVHNNFNVLVRDAADYGSSTPVYLNYQNGKKIMSDDDIDDFDGGFEDDETDTVMDKPVCYKTSAEARRRLEQLQDEKMLERMLKDEFDY